MQHANTFLVGAALFLMASFSWGLSSDATKPLQITSDRFEGNQLSGKAIYIGHVVADQGTRHLSANKVILHRNKQGEIDHVQAYGHLAHYRYQPQKNKPWVDAYGEEIEVFPLLHQLILHQKAKLTQGRDHLSAAVIYYNTQTQQVKTTQSKQEKRTQMIIHPQDYQKKTPS